MPYNKISAKPPYQKAQAIESFINAANKPKQVIEREKLPWDSENCRDDVKKAFTVVLPEEYILKLQYIKECTNQSQQKIVRNAICIEVDKIVKQLLNQ